jgi:hypothetical protein
VQASSLTVVSLGRLFASGNAGIHTIKLVRVTDNVDVPGGSVSLSMIGGTPGQFSYAALAAPLSLPAGSSYYLVTQEFQGGDRWYDYGSIATAPIATSNASIYSFDGIRWIITGASNTSYVPPNFLYSIGPPPAQYSLSSSVTPTSAGAILQNPSSAGGSFSSGTQVQLTATPSFGCNFLNWSGDLSGSANPQTLTMSAAKSVTANFACTGPTGTPFLTGATLNNPILRNDFTGWVGFRFTTGANALRVTALGRMFVNGNAQTHAAKIVRASDGTDVPGSVASVSMIGGAAGQFAYAALTDPVTLQANSAYYLVTQETQGADGWFDFGTIASTADASVNSSVYSFNGSQWIPVAGPNTSYVPPNFVYTVVTASPISVSVNSDPTGRSLSIDGATFTSSQQVVWTAGTSHTLAAPSPQAISSATQYVRRSWSDGGTISHSVTPSSAATFTATFVKQYLLTTAAFPPGSGSVSPSVTTSDGYYDEGTSPELTALPSAGCTFLSWAGDLTGTGSVQTCRCRPLAQSLQTFSAQPRLPPAHSSRATL